MNEPESRNIETVRKYYDGCNSGDIEDMMSTFAPNVTHYFLPSSLPPIHGAKALATNWKWWKDNLHSVFAHDHLIAQGDEVVSEFSCVFTPPGTKQRLINRGTEWYVMRDGKILEVRAYCIVNTEHSVELAKFPYAERGYPAHTTRGSPKRSTDLDRATTAHSASAPAPARRGSRFTTCTTIRPRRFRPNSPTASVDIYVSSRATAWKGRQPLLSTVLQATVCRPSGRDPQLRRRGGRATGVRTGVAMVTRRQPIANTESCQAPHSNTT